MRDISAKTRTLRTATARARLHMSSASVQSVKENSGPKRDILPTARAAAFLAAKNTSNVIPHCHPIPVEAATVEFGFFPEGIEISVTVKAIYRTGVEMEALHAASVAALVIYDMLKPLDDDISITAIELKEKKGGKHDFQDTFDRLLRAAVIVCSDAVSSGKKQDSAGAAIEERVKAMNVQLAAKEIVPDEPEQIREAVKRHAAAGVDLILTTGGTGLGPRDSTPQALRDLIETEVPGLMEAARAHGQERTPLAMMSRGIAGLIGRSLIITLPGSSRGAAETMDALFPWALHIFKVLDHGYRHGK